MNESPLARALPVGRSRLPSLDVTRGVAMIFVCLSHFCLAAVASLGATRTFSALITISMLASPTFMLVSGLTLGYAYSARRDAFRAFSHKLLARGAYLVTGVHLLMIPPQYYLSARGHPMRSLFITDAIGLNFLIAPWLMTHVRWRARIVAAIGLLVLGAVMVGFIPLRVSLPVQVLRDTLSGTLGQSLWFSSFPLIPWLVPYLVGSAIGESLSAHTAGAERANALVLLRWSAISLGTAVSLEALARVIVQTASGERTLMFASWLGDPWTKQPPSPTYLAFFLGVGLLITAVLTLVLGSDRPAWFIRRLANAGRASLFLFVLQAYVYFVIYTQWIHPGAYWVVNFLVSLVVLAVLAHAWLRVTSSTRRNAKTARLLGDHHVARLQAE